MPHLIADRVKDTTATTGTGNVTLSGSAPSGFRTFGSVLANNDTTYYCIAGQSGTEWEVGLGTYVSATPALARTTVLASSNAGALVSFSAGTKDVFIAAAAARLPQLDHQLVMKLPAVAALPTAPEAGILSIFARLTSGRMLPKWMGPSGVDTFIQPAIFGNRIVAYNPSTGTTGTGAGCGLGPNWTANGTVSHPTPSTASPAVSNQMKRTRFANVATTADQQLGPRFNVASEQQFWRGNAAGLGGFFYACRFIVELIPASTIRIWAGLVASATSTPVISNTVALHCVGLWHDTTDPISGANSMNLVSYDGTTASKTSIALSNAIIAGNSYDFYMFCAPQGTEIFYRLDDLVNNVIYEGSKTTNLPGNTQFMQPQCQMSNGANGTVTTTAIGVAGIYCESDR